MRKPQSIPFTSTSILQTHGNLKMIQILFLYSIVQNFCSCLCLRAQPTHTQEPSRPSCACTRSLEVREAPQDTKPNCWPSQKGKNRLCLGLWSNFTMEFALKMLILAEPFRGSPIAHCPALSLTLLCCLRFMEWWKAGTSGCICVTSVWCQVQFGAKGFHAKGTSTADFM